MLQKIIYGENFFQMKPLEPNWNVVLKFLEKKLIIDTKIKELLLIREYMKIIYLQKVKTKC